MCLCNKLQTSTPELPFGALLGTPAALQHLINRSIIIIIISGIINELQLENLNEIASDVAACNVKSSRQMRKRKSIVDWTNVRHTIAGVNHHASLKT